jgi:hypothetical protein
MDSLLGGRIRGSREGLMGWVHGEIREGTCFSVGEVG